MRSLKQKYFSLKVGRDDKDDHNGKFAVSDGHHQGHNGIAGGNNIGASNGNHDSSTGIDRSKSFVATRVAIVEAKVEAASSGDSDCTCNAPTRTQSCTIKHAHQHNSKEGRSSEDPFPDKAGACDLAQRAYVYAHMCVCARARVWVCVSP